MSGSAPTIAMRALRAVGRPELTLDPKFAEAQQRLRNAAEIDAIMADWIRQRTLDQPWRSSRRRASPPRPSTTPSSCSATRSSGRAVSIRRSTIRNSARCGSRRPLPRFSATPGAVSHLGPRLGADNAEVYGGLLGLDGARLRELHEQGVI